MSFVLLKIINSDGLCLVFDFILAMRNALLCRSMLMNCKMFKHYGTFCVRTIWCASFTPEITSYFRNPMKLIANWMSHTSVPHVNKIFNRWLYRWYTLCDAHKRISNCVHCIVLFQFSQMLASIVGFPRILICTFNTIIKWCLCIYIYIARATFMYIVPLLCNWKLMALVFIVSIAKRSESWKWTKKNNG